LLLWEGREKACERLIVGNRLRGVGQLSHDFGDAAGGIARRLALAGG
jgi:hypothetical protein